MTVPLDFLVVLAPLAAMGLIWLMSE